jgi:DNA-binding GntR family transcriptional regulator
MVVQRDCMRAQIRRELILRIVRGAYRPGERLVELKIAREFNTSQAPVREALRELEALHLVETQSYRGTRVRAISERELAEASDVRGVLEEAASVPAAESLRGRTEGLRQALEAIEAAGRDDDVDAYSHHNRDFHRQIVRAAGNDVLLRVWDSLLLETLTLIGLNARPSDLEALAVTHRPILEALDRGDGALAGRLLREHAKLARPDPPQADPSPPL